MAEAFALEVVTPEGRLFTGRVTSAVLPGMDGQFGILAKHAPLLSVISIGIMDLTFESGERHSYAVGDGFVEVSPDGTVKVLTDFSDESGDIDTARAKQAEERARERLAHRDEKVDRVRAETSLRRAMMRLKVTPKL